MTLQGKRVLIMAGGTGGHVYPALSIAAALSASGAEIHWLGNRDGFEASRVAAAGYPLHDIAMHGIRGQKRLSTPFMLVRALWRAYRVLKRLQPHLVLGMGGFASAPGGWLAAKMGLPLVIHEQNAAVGLSNRKLAPLARKVLLAYPEALQALQQQGIPTEKMQLVGNPVRAEITAVDAPSKRFLGRHGRIKLLVLGGSQGAQRMNQILPEALALLAEHERPELWHQTGVKHQAATEALYRQLGIEARVTPFIEDMASAYAQADWVMARSGALSVAEIANVGLSALFIPFPHAVDDHQYANAQVLVTAGAAQCWRQEALQAKDLAQFIRQQQNRGVLLQQAERARLALPRDATAQIMAALKQILEA